jgi:hypothetical protein
MQLKIKKQIINTVIFCLSFVLAIKFNLLQFFWLFSYIFIIKQISKEFNGNKLIRRFIKTKFKKIWNKN